MAKINSETLLRNDYLLLQNATTVFKTRLSGSPQLLFMITGQSAQLVCPEKKEITELYTN